MPALSNVTVLILDDNPLVLKLGRALLEREGSTVLTASSWIEFNHVLAGECTFAYGKERVLSDVSLKLAPGGITVVIGPCFSTPWIARASKARTPGRSPRRSTNG